MITSLLLTAKGCCECQQQAPKHQIVVEIVLVVLMCILLALPMLYFLCCFVVEKFREANELKRLEKIIESLKQNDEEKIKND